VVEILALAEVCALRVSLCACFSYRDLVYMNYRSPSTSSPSSVSTIDAKALRQISAEAGSPTASVGVDVEEEEEQAVRDDETGSPQVDTELTPACSEVDRKALVKQRWINAINKVRDQISQVSHYIRPTVL